MRRKRKVVRDTNGIPGYKHWPTVRFESNFKEAEKSERKEEKK